VVEIPTAFREVLTRLEHPEGTAFVLEDDGLLNDVVQWLLRTGAKLRAVTPHRATLEELFMEAADGVRGKREERSA
jgi:hypothetical protein